jgi:hypothetical protein
MQISVLVHNQACQRKASITPAFEPIDIAEDAIRVYLEHNSTAEGGRFFTGFSAEIGSAIEVAG